MAKRIGGRTQLELETMEARLVLTAATAVGLTAPPPAIVDVAVQETAVDTSDISDTIDTLGRGDTSPVDFNADGEVNAADIDFLSAIIRHGTYHETYDLNGDKELTKGDMDSMIHDWMETEYGDADLDGAVDIRDFSIWSTHAFQVGGWATGDFDGDFYVDGHDFLAWNHSKNIQTQQRIAADDSDTPTSEELEDETVTETDDAVDETQQQPLQQPLSSGESYSTSTSHDLDEEAEEKSRDDDFLQLG